MDRRELEPSCGLSPAAVRSGAPLEAFTDIERRVLARIVEFDLP